MNGTGVGGNEKGCVCMCAVGDGKSACLQPVVLGYDEEAGLGFEGGGVAPPQPREQADKQSQSRERWGNDVVET